MGTTSASFHLLCKPDDAVKAISRAYVKLGYERLKKPAAEPGKQVIVFAVADEPFVSVYDSTNADLDSGELKDAALAASKLLKTGAVMTSLYDSDSYEFVVFSSGRQIDLLMTDAENYDGPLKQLRGRSRVTQWNNVFRRGVTSEQIERAAQRRSAFADDAVGALSGLVGLSRDRAQRHYSDFAEEDEEAPLATLHFARKRMPEGIAEGQIVLRNYYDPDNSRKLLVYPAAWPMPVGREELLTWLMLSDGAGFRGGVASVEVEGPEGLSIPRGFINGAKFHNGQIVGGYELPSNTPVDEAKAYLESKRFSLELVVATAAAQSYRAAYPNLFVPPWTPQRTTQILLVMQLYLAASQPGEWTVKVTLRPGEAEDSPVLELPPARVAAVAQQWLPVVSGLNPKATYDTADIEDPVPDSAVDIHLQRSFGGVSAMAAYGTTSPAEAREKMQRQLADGRARNYQNWRQDIPNVQRRASESRRLDHPAVASNVAILRDEGRTTLDRCRAHLEEWLRPLADRGGIVHLNAERQMTEAFHVGKVKKQWASAEVMRDKAWGRLFATEGEYQSAVIEWLPPGNEFPIAGAGMHFSFRKPQSTAPARIAQQADTAEYDALLFAATLGKMRGRQFVDPEDAYTAHLFDWVLNAEACWAAIGTTATDMKARLARLAAGPALFQAWHQQATWIPAFDRAEDYQATAYEQASLLNYFRGILHGHQQGLMAWRMSAEWCSNILRTVAPEMWLCRSLAEQLDPAALAKVATITEVDGNFRIEKHPDCPMDAFELALLPILPIETVRVTVP